MKHLTIALLIILALTTTATAQNIDADSAPEFDPCQVYEIRFMQYTYNGDNQIVWEYEAEALQDAPHDMSNMSIAIASCYEVVSCWPEPCEVGTDPHTGITGVKWEAAEGEEFIKVGETKQVGFITEGSAHSIGTVDTGMKSSGLVCTYNDSAGPVCDPNEVTLKHIDAHETNQALLFAMTIALLVSAAVIVIITVYRRIY